MVHALSEVVGHVVVGPHGLSGGHAGVDDPVGGHVGGHLWSHLGIGQEPQLVKHHVGLLITHPPSVLDSVEPGHLLVKL